MSLSLGQKAVRKIVVNSLRLMAILAHPDDEPLRFGGILAKSAAMEPNVAISD